VTVPRGSLLVLQHIACEPPAAFEDELRDRGWELRRVEVDEGESIPDPGGFAGVVVMGGPMGAYEEERLPWLAAEKRLVGAAARAGTPVWGVCLGAQLLAASLGARVYAGPEPEVGVLDVRLTRAATTDPVFAGAPARFPALQWHGDTFDLPPGARLLAESDMYRHQAFAVGRAYGLQFHLEVGAGLAAEWGDVPVYAAALESIRGPGAVDGLVDELAAAEAETVPLARELFGRWLDLADQSGAR
jgi:GMP synthase (glutamine-hydrolysing)